VDYKSAVCGRGRYRKPLIQNGLSVRDVEKGGGSENLHPTASLFDPRSVIREMCSRMSCHQAFCVSQEERRRGRVERLNCRRRQESAVLVLFQMKPGCVLHQLEECLAQLLSHHAHVVGLISSRLSVDTAQV
jgi:hypothetical protein